jgi:hypothetical protein
MQPSNLWGYGSEHIEVVEHAIGGKLISARVYLPTDTFSRISGDDAVRQVMREKLTTALAQGMLDKQLIEINSYYDPASDNNVIVAHAYVAPNGDIKILRTYK